MGGGQGQDASGFGRILEGVEGIATGGQGNVVYLLRKVPPALNAHNTKQALYQARAVGGLRIDAEIFREKGAGRYYNRGIE